MGIESETALGDEELFFEMIASPEVGACVHVHQAGDECVIGPEGGDWVSAYPNGDVASESLMFALVVALALAMEMGVGLVDDWGLLSLGREVSVTQAVASVRHLSDTGSFSSAARALLDAPGHMK
jgi:hypothetical protein